MTEMNHFKVLAVALATVLAASVVVVAEAAIQSISSGQISRMNADGFGPAQLTDTGSNYTPAWSADGTKLAFTSGRDGDKEVFRMGSGGLNAANLTNNTKLDISASWQPLLGR